MDAFLLGITLKKSFKMDVFKIKWTDIYTYNNKQTRKKEREYLYI